MNVKRLFLKGLLVTEMITLVYIYLFGMNGVVMLQTQRNIVVQLQKDITLLEEDIRLLKEEIDKWNNHDFYKEKVAREQLQMARKGDELFYIGT